MNQHARLDIAPIPFIDVGAQRRRLGRAIDDAIARVTDALPVHQRPGGGGVRDAISRRSAAPRHAVGCASGTDALVLVLMARGIGPGDAVICPAFTFCATAEVVALVGATPVFADVDADDLQHRRRRACKRAIATAKRHGLKPKAVIPVDLFGLPADHDAHRGVAKAEGLFVLDDAAQGFGATYKGRKLGTLRAGDRDELLSGQAARLLRRRRRGAHRRRRPRRHAQEPARARAGHRQIRQRPHRHDQPPRHHPGRGADREAEDLPRRDRGARRGRARATPRRSRDVAIVPRCPTATTSVWAQYTIRLAAGRRDALAAALKAQGIPTAIYYPKPLHRQDGLSSISRWPTTAFR